MSARTNAAGAHGRVRPSEAAVALSERFRLALDETPRGGAMGERAGRGIGSSLEFTDRRSYLAGDDLRHVDWRAYARTDQLLVRQFREEVAPRLRLVLDASMSMAADSAKAAFAVDLVAAFAAIGRAEGLPVRIEVSAAETLVLPATALAAEGVAFDGDRPLSIGLRAASSTSRALTVVVSDFFDPAGAEPMINPIERGALRFACVQVLTRAELEPEREGPLRLTDVESGRHRDLVVDARSIREYRERLDRLTTELESECRRRRGTFARVIADDGLDVALRDVLVPCGVVKPRD